MQKSAHLLEPNDEALDRASCSALPAVPPERAVGIHTLMVKYMAKPADDETVGRWATEVRRAVRDRFGLKEGDRRMKIAKEFIENRPEFAGLLTTTGLGSHPRIVRALVERPDALRLKPRAEKKKA
jgi:hypothetical protein